MTCIIGLEYKGTVYMGGDSMASDGWNTEETGNPKVFILKDFIIGYTTSFRMGQLIQYHFIPPEYTLPEITNYPMPYLVTKFIPELRSILKEHGYTKIENNKEEIGELLVGVRGTVYKIQADYSVIKSINLFQTIGIGEQYSKGAMEALLSFLNDPDPKEVILQALSVTGTFSNGVCPPYYVLSK